jgi:hypothetical protein
MVCHRSNGYPAQQSTTKAADSANSARQKSEQKSVAHRTVSGVAPYCLMLQEDKASNDRLLQTLTVGWCGGTPDSLQDLSGSAPDCPVRPSPAAFPNGLLVVEGYKYPQPPQLQAPKSSEVFIQYKS